MNDQSSSSTTTLDYALKYCECQFSVLPLAAKDKRPILNTWKPRQNERADGEQIRRWFSNTEYNIAISTGKISSIIAFDIDGDRAKKYFEDSVEKLNDEGIRAALKNTMHIKTGGGNINIVIGFDPVDFPDGQVIKNSVLWRSSGNGNNNKEEHSEIRLKGEGGYIVAPPSIHPNGNQYGFVNEVASPIRLSKEQIFNLIAALKQQQSTTTLQTENIKSNENGIATTSSIGSTNQNQSCEFGKENLSNIIACLKTYYRQGERNDFVMYLAGWFRKEGVAIQSAIKVVEELAENDEEKHARFRTVEETYKKQDLNGINGYSGLLSMLTGQLQSKEKACQLLSELKLLFPVP